MFLRNGIIWVNEFANIPSTFNIVAKFKDYTTFSWDESCSLLGTNPGGL